MIPPLAMTYLVYWPRYGVMKAGRAWKMSRLRGLVAAGAEIIVLVRDTPSTWEKGGLEALTERFDKRFESSIDASRLLPHDGSGWTECFWVLNGELSEAITTFIEGTTRYADDEAKVRDAGGDDRRGSRGAPSVHTVPRRGAAHVGGRRGPRTPELREHQGRGLPERRSHDGGVAAARGDRPGTGAVHAVVDSGREAVLPDPPAASHATGEAQAVPAPAPTRPDAIRIRSGCRPGRGERGRGRSGRAAGRPRAATDVLSRSPAFRVRGSPVWSMQGRTHGARSSDTRTESTAERRRR